MKNTTTVLVYIFLCFATACNQAPGYIVETDISKISTDASKDGLTVEENMNFGSFVTDSVKKNTIGKSLPDITVTDLSNRKLKLRDKISVNCIIISSDIYCSYGLDGLSAIFPKAIKMLDKQLMNTQVICLLKKTHKDDANPELFNNVIKELKSSYSAIYIVDKRDAGKLNLCINPTRLYLNKHKVVTNIELGLPSLEELYKEIKQNTIAENKPAKRNLASLSLMRSVVFPL
jgi:hypothetical protein